MKEPKTDMNRRHFLQTLGGMGAGLIAGPYILRCSKFDKPVKRILGSTGFEVTTLGLGGQASIQWTPSDEVPYEIIIKAYKLGVNYFDTSNLYEDSQLRYGKAFRILGLTPGMPDYDEKKRAKIFVASKTRIRYAKGSREGIRARTGGPPGSTAVDDLRRSLSQMFGDGKGNYPDGAYIDLFQTHNLTKQKEIDALYEGLENPDPNAERIGTLAALLDFRDGTNRTGLNPRNEKLIRHIGITGHNSSPVLMDCIQRDKNSIIETILTVGNANDRLYFNHQYNVMPVAAAKGMGIIGMKVFSDGAMYDKEPHWTRGPHEVVRRIGTPELPSAPLIQYSLSHPGVATNIIGIGHIDKDPKLCQLEQNLSASQIEEGLSSRKREEIEQMAAGVKGGETNYFQLEAEPLSAPQNPAITQEMKSGERIVRLSWHTAFAGDQPISHYEINRDGKFIARVEHKPQITKDPFTFEDHPIDRKGHEYKIVTRDKAERPAVSGALVVEDVG